VSFIVVGRGRVAGFYRGAVGFDLDVYEAACGFYFASVAARHASAVYVQN
jgi:hypothetical protein